MHDTPVKHTGMAHTAQPDPVALFVSDVHLKPSLPRTTQAFFDLLRGRARNAQQLYLLGDIFEYWAGDDDIVEPYNKQVLDAIRQVSDAGTAVFWMAGNRDFLVGDGFAKAAGLTLLPDPFVTTIAGLRITLVHGDEQCTDDAAYMAFRAQVRQPAWQQQFLAMPLVQRKAIIAGLRDESQKAQRTKSYDIMDVNAAAIGALFDDSGTSIMIHGHTHRPARHDYEGRTRYVLPDWECDVEPQRGGWIELAADGTIRRCNIEST
ncbi:MAG: UDP-2,3-diacylglucosamine hydrolase [Burkholderiales bacterium]|jgi:UDP-2,3-diacylglucosamine hydrolase